jgi:hypothetical protein
VVLTGVQAIHTTMTSASSAAVIAILGVALASVVFRRLDPAKATWWVGVEADDPADPVTEVLR